MKKTSKLFAFFLAVSSMLVIQSCDKGEDINPAPTVTVDPTTAQNIPGGAVSAALTVTAPNGPQDLVIYVSGVEVETRDISATDISAPIDYDYTIPADAVVGSKIVVSFQVIDYSRVPTGSYKPKTRLIVVISTFLGFFVGIFSIFLIATIEKLKREQSKA